MTGTSAFPHLASSSRLRWLLLPLTWIAAALVTSMPQGRAIENGVVTVIPRWPLIVDQLIGYGWWALLFPAVLGINRRIAAMRVPLARRSLVHVMAGAVFIGMHFLLRSSIHIPGHIFNVSMRWDNFRAMIPSSLAVYLILLFGILAVRAYEQSHERERENATMVLKATQLESQLSTARLDLLRAQLHPHFLFNALHSISALIAVQPEAAQTMLIRLGDLLRLSLRAMESREITLAQELEWLEQYVELQQLRYESRLTLDIHVGEDTLGALVPPLVLQPMVENAIKYAVEPRATGGYIEVVATRRGAELELAVRDDGPGVSSTGIDGSGVGLNNSRNRLAALYGMGYTLTLRTRRGGGVEALITVPYRKMEGT